jgi:outer membrane protein
MPNAMPNPSARRLPLAAALSAATLIAGLLPLLASATDLHDIYVDARDNDPRLAAARASYGARAQAVPIGQAALLPVVTLSGSTEANRRSVPGHVTDTNPNSPTFRQRVQLSPEEFNEHTWQAQLRQPVVNLERWFTYLGARSQRTQAEWELKTAEQDLLLRAADAYFAVLRAQDQLESARAEESAVRRQLEQVQQRFDVGLVAITDVLESQAAFDNSVVRRIQADGNHDIVFETLGTLTGSRYDTLERLSDDMPFAYPEPRDEDAWVAEALARNAGIQSTTAALLTAERDVRARMSAHLPTVDAVASYSHFVTGGRNFIGSATDTSAYVLQAQVPVFQGGATQARVRESQYRVEAARQSLEERRRTVTRDTRNLFRAMITDTVRVRARRKSIRSSQAALDATQTGYEVGTRNIVDVLQAQQRLFASQFDFADARYSYILDLLRLKQATGTLADADLDELNAFLTDAGVVQRLPIGRLYEEDAEAEVPEAPSPVAPPPAR